MEGTDPRDWLALAACSQHDPNLWNATSGSFETAETRAAKAICESCFAKLDCLNEAIEQGEDYGVRGGMLPRERLVERDYRRIFHYVRPATT